MAKKITIELSQSSIEKAIAELEAYQKRLDSKIKQFANELANVGVSVGNGNKGTAFGDHVVFEKRVKLDRNYHIVIDVVERNIEMVHVVWDTGEADVNPLLMVEFGSGQFADNKRGPKFGAGRGTFPGQKHAFQDSWSWTVNGKKYASKGYKPHAPIVVAYNEMVSDIQRIARKVFGGV